MHQKLLLPLGGNMEDSGNEESQQDVERPSDCIQAVFDDGEAETEVMSTDPEPKGKSNAIHIQCVQMIHDPNYWVNSVWRWAKSLFWHQ